MTTIPAALLLLANVLLAFAAAAAYMLVKTRRPVWAAVLVVFWFYATMTINL